MKIAQEFIDAVTQKDIMMVHIMLKDSLVVDPTFVEFDAMLEYASEQMGNIYDEHDGEELLTDKNDWDKQYMNNQLFKLVNNFSKERIKLLKAICRYLFSDRVKKITEERVVDTVKESGIAKSQIGTGVAAAGAITTVAGVIVSKPLIIGVGALATVAGIITVMTDD